MKRIRKARRFVSSPEGECGFRPENELVEAVFAHIGHTALGALRRLWLSVMRLAPTSLLGRSACRGDPQPLRGAAVPTGPWDQPARQTSLSGPPALAKRGTRGRPVSIGSSGEPDQLPVQSSVMAWISAATLAAFGSAAPDCMAINLVMSPWTLTLPAMNACIPACGLPSTRIAFAVP